MNRLAAAIVGLCLVATPGWAQVTARVERNAVEAHMNFLAGPELQGRGSATRDEAIAAAYVASQFRLAGLTPPPGMAGYLQQAPVTRTTPSGEAILTVGDVTLRQGPDFAVLSGGLNSVSGVVSVAADPLAPPASLEAVLVAPPEGPGVRSALSAAAQAGARLILMRRNEALAQATGDGPRRKPVIRLADTAPRSGPVILVLSPEAYDRLAATAGGQAAAYDPGAASVENTVTTNVIGWLAGTDPDGPVLMVSAHLDHIGLRPDGVVMHGANDDASGTVAVIELARALSGTGPHRMNVMFVAYGSEEAGLLGSRWFVEHPPIALDRIAANLEIEMIGDQDPQLPAGVMMMTGFDRSNFGAEMKARGALVGPDPYPEQNFFERSDNYALAQKGVVAHTVSGWATTPTYHTPDDTLDSINFDFMTQAIQSLVAPLAAVADGEFAPTWAEGGRPDAR